MNILPYFNYPKRYDGLSIISLWNKLWTRTNWFHKAPQFEPFYLLYLMLWESELCSNTSPCRWTHQGPPKLWYPSATLHGVTAQMTSTWVIRYSNWLRPGRSDDWSSNPGSGWEFLSSTLCLDRLWGLLSLLSNGYQGLFPWGYSVWGVKLTTHHHLVPRSKNAWSFISNPPIRLYGVVLS
jgi:hypothetical protein